MQGEEELMLFEQAQKGENQSKETLILANIGLVHMVAKRYMRRGIEVEDLFQIGTIGLMKAVEKFDVNYGVCFSTYAVPMIAGEIRRHLRDDGMIKVSRGIKENLWKISVAKENIMKETGREPTISEISSQTGIIMEDIVVALDAGKEVESIYKTVYQSDGNEIYLIDQISEGSEELYQENEVVINQIFLKELLSGLNGREKELIRLRYYDNKTQTQVASILGMTQVQVSRMEKKILVNLRKKATD